MLVFIFKVRWKKKQTPFSGVSVRFLAEDSNLEPSDSRFISYTSTFFIVTFLLTTGAEPPCGCRGVTKLDLQCRKGKSSPKRILDSKVGSSDLLDRFGLQVQDICI
jgi:hypothetical protein